MSRKTTLDSRMEVIYQIFPRQYSKSHNLQGITNDLKRIKDLGVTIIYLMPIHPIGVKDRKGSVGSPYAIYDYTKVDENLGGIQQLNELIAKAHELDLKIMMDIVFNHTSRDSVLTQAHPEWFYHKPNGDFANRVGDWSDITDFNYHYQEQIEYLTNVLLMYEDLGVDGFRFDVAPLIPERFWDYAVPKMKEKNPNLILLSESVHLGFTKYLRDLGYEAMSDSEMFKWFDMLYEYDIYPALEEFVQGKEPISKFLNLVQNQESLFPANYNKIRYLENHDFGRMNSYIHDDIIMQNLLVLNYFLKGSTFLYAGIETLTDKQPNLFEFDEVDWNHMKPDVVELIKKLNSLKKTDTMAKGIWNYEILAKSIVKITIEDKEQIITAIINLNHSKKTIPMNMNKAFNYLLDKEKAFKSTYRVNDLPEIFIVKKQNTAD